MFSCLAASSLVFANPQWLWIAAGFGLVALALLLFGYRNSPLALGWKAAAVLLKLMAFVLLTLVLLEPVWVDEFPRNGANDLVILADNSRGLSINQQGETLQTALKHDKPDDPPRWLAKLDELFRVQRYMFDRRLSRVDDFSKLDFSGNASSVLTSLKSLRNRFQKRPLAAMVMFTDGNATDSAGLDAVLEAIKATPESKVPIYPVLVGSGLQEVRDLSIRDVRVAQSSFEDAPVTVTVNAAARGSFPNGVEVAVVDEDEKELMAEPIIFAGQQTVRNGNVRLKVPVVKTGVSFYRVILREPKLDEDGDAEVTLENNSRLISVDRGQGPYRILYVSGRPNWEYKFLRRSLAQDAELDLVALLRIAKREPKFEWRGRTGESGNPLFRGFGKDLPEETQSYDEPVLIRLNTKDDEELRDGFPRDAKTLYSDYRAIIFDDVEAEFLSAEQQNLVENFVTKRGGTVIMLGGQESFKSGKWDNTPMARLLPVYVDRINRGGAAQFATYNLSREGWLENWMRLRDNQTDETSRLAFMPEFFSINRIPAIKPGASLLATVTDREQRQHPAVVTQRYGEGRSAAVLVGDFWRWGMKDELVQKDLAKMWRQLIRWAVAEVPGQVTGELTQVSEGTLPMVKIATRVRTDEFLPRDDATVRYELTEPNAKEPLRLSGEPSLSDAGTFTTDHFIEKEGAYRLKTIARDGSGKILGEQLAGWAFNPAADEFRSIEPNRNLLQQIANSSGGEVIELTDVATLVDKLRDLNVPVTDTRQRPFWHAPWVFFLALLCMIGEWGIRRWKGAIL